MKLFIDLLRLISRSLYYNKSDTPRTSIILIKLNSDMLIRSRTFVLFFSIAFAVSILISCSDDSSTGIDEGEPPQIPEAAPVEIDNSVFQDNNPTGEEYDAFNEAGTLTEGANANLVSATSMGQSFLMFTQGQNASFEDGRWVWTFSYSAEGETLTIKTTAEEESGGIEWNLYLTGNFEDEGSLDEFRYLSGYTSNDGVSGNWQYYFPGEPGQPYIVYEWETISDTEFTFSSVVNLPDEEEEFRVDYDRNGEENSLEYSGYDFDQNVSVFWNSSTGTGYIDRPGEDRRCWDDSFAETTCG